MSYSKWSEVSCLNVIACLLWNTSEKGPRKLGLEMNGSHSRLFCAHIVIPLIKYLQKRRRRNAKFLTTKEVHVEENTEKTNLYVYVCSP
jgi:hypothetical protein